MKLKIKRFPLGTSGTYQVEMPYGSQILSVVNFKDIPTVFAMVDEESTMCSSTFVVFETFQEIESKQLNSLKFLGTVQDEWTIKEWHVFERVFK